MPFPLLYRIDNINFSYLENQTVAALRSLNNSVILISYSEKQFSFRKQSQIINVCFIMTVSHILLNLYVDMVFHVFDRG